MMVTEAKSLYYDTNTAMSAGLVVFKRKARLKSINVAATTVAANSTINVYNPPNSVEAVTSGDMIAVFSINTAKGDPIVVDMHNLELRNPFIRFYAGSGAGINVVILYDDDKCPLFQTIKEHY